jgi:hypothetical protein
MKLNLAAGHESKMSSQPLSRNLQSALAQNKTGQDCACNPDVIHPLQADDANHCLRRGLTLATQIAQWAGFGAGVAGSYALALGHAPQGWALFAASNLLWIVAAIRNNQLPLGLMMMAYMPSSVMGLINSFHQ